jgi:hypothetical protein
LQDGKCPKSHLGVRSFEDVPSYRGRVHPAAYHRDQIGGKNETQRALVETGTHLPTLAEAGGIHHERHRRGQLTEGLKCEAAKKIRE